MPVQQGQAGVRQAREYLLEHGDLPNGMLTEPIERSWRRSMQAGLQPVGRLPEAPHLSPQALARATDRQQELMSHARPVMEYLYGQMRDSGSVVILSDERGMLLNVIGDAGFLTRAERVALAPGACWHERYRGTNAIGTALAEVAPVVVHGGEHFLERNNFLTCAAAPVTAPDGRLLGVFDVSGDHRSRHPHTFGFVRAAAQMIENRLFDARHGHDMRLRFHPLAEGIGTLAEGVAALSEDGRIVGVNHAGLALLGIQAAHVGDIMLEEVVDQHVSRLADWGKRHPGRPMLVSDRRGRQLFVRVELGLPRARGALNDMAVRAALGESVIDAQVEAATGAAEADAGDALRRLDTGDAAMAAVIARVRKVIDKPIALLLHGESGVGKELFARALHQSGPRRSRPFVAVNCAAMPEALIETELFGYTSGAYTGARREGAPGRIREAHGGTLLLDEIGDMPLALQSRLLRVLQERQVTPVGGGSPVSVDFALVCATHRDLKAEVGAGRFRADLYYRINGLTVSLPALRERSDFTELVHRIIEDTRPGAGIVLAPELMRAFTEYHWPGNLRQLCNAVHTACALLDPHENVIGWHHLADELVDELRDPAVASSTASADAIVNLREASTAAIHRAVRAARGNLSEAARRLGISRNTLYRRLKKTGVRM